MVLDAAVGVVPARAGTRVSASLVYAGLVERALAVAEALRPTRRRRAEVAGLALALAVAGDLLGDGVGATRIRVARVAGLLNWISV